MSRNTGVPDVVLERYRLGELPAAEAAHVQERLRGDDRLRQRLEELEASDREIRRRYPPEWLADRIREHLGAGDGPSPRRAAPWSARWQLPVALAAAAAVILVLAPLTLGPPSTETSVPSAAPGSSDRLKGLEPALTMYRRTPAGSEALSDGATVFPGDRIRIGYRAAGHTYGVILSVDGRGRVSVHLASHGTHAAPLRSGETVLLDQAFELDDAPLWERFYFVAAEQPFALAPIVEAAGRMALERRPGPAPRLPLPASYRQFVMTLAKEVRP